MVINIPARFLGCDEFNHKKISRGFENINHFKKSICCGGLDDLEDKSIMVKNVGTEKI